MVFDDEMANKDYFVQNENAMVQQLIFSQMKQKPIEAFSQFDVRFKMQAKHCWFQGSLERMLMAQTFNGAHLKKVRGKAILDKVYSFEELIKFASEIELVLRSCWDEKSQ